MGAAVIAAAAFYRPLVVWANNAWDLSSPERLLAMGAAVSLIAISLYLLLVRRGLGPGPTALGVAGTILVLMSWSQLPAGGWWWLVGVAVGALVAHRRVSEAGARWAMLGAIAIVAVAPALQVVLSHLKNTEQYPIVDLAPREDASPTGIIEDVLLVFVDGYPSRAIASGWFGHDTSELDVELADRGFSTPRVAWSHHTFTRLAIPSVLELQPIAEPGPTGGWGNHTSTYRIIGGESFVASAFRSAGYTHTHIDSGWNGGACGTADVCLPNHPIDEALWKMLRPSVIGEWMASSLRSHTVGNTLRTVEQLSSLRLTLDGERNFVFAHMLLPHAPFVVDADCRPTRDPADDYSGLEEISTEMPDPGAVRSQLTCVDGLILEIVRSVGPETAVVITGDHGSGVLGQGATSSHVWSDAEIAERLGIFLAYRMPPECPEPEAITNIAVMRAVTTCALDVHPPAHEPVFLLGSNDLQLVTLDRIRRIEQQLFQGSLDLEAWAADSS